MLQPFRGIPLDKSHPICKEMAAAFPLNDYSGSNVWDYFNGKSQAITDPSGEVSWVGGGLHFEGSGDYGINTGYGWPGGLTEFSIYIPRFNYINSSFTANHALVVNDNQFTLRGDSGNNKLRMYFYSGAWRGPVISNTNVCGKTYHSVVGTYDNSALKLYIDGVLDATNTPGSYTVASSGGSYGLLIGTNTMSSSTQQWQGDIGGCYLFDRVLTAEEVAFLEQMLIDAFEDDPPMLRFYPVTSGAMSGTCTITITSTGSLDGNGALSGSSNITVTGSGVMTGTGAMSATSSISVTSTGNLSATGALSGSSNITVTGTGSLTGSGAMSGVSNVSVSGIGNLTGSGAMSATIPIVITATGNLTDLGSGAMSGTCSVTITSTGNLVGSGALSGASNISVTGAGNLTGSGAMSGVSIVSVTSTGILSGTGSLSGSSNISISGLGVLTGIGGLSGTSSIVITSIGNLINSTAGAMSGTCSIVISSTGNLIGIGGLSGTSSIITTGTGVLIDSGTTIPITILNDLLSSITSSMTVANGYNYDAGSVSKWEVANATYPRHLVTLGKETNNDLENGANRYIYDNDLELIWRTEYMNTGDPDSLDHKLVASKMRDDIKQFVGENPQLSSSCHFIYVDFDPDISNDNTFSVECTARLGVNYRQYRSNPSKAA